MRQGRLEEALSLYAKDLAIQEEAFDVDDPHLHNTLREYAAALRKCDRPEDAAQVEKRIPEQ